MAQRIGTGPIILQSYSPGEAPDSAHHVDYVAGTWEFTPGVTLTDIMGPLGARVIKLPTAVQPQFTMETMSSPIRVERARLHGMKTDLPAQVAAGNIRYVTAFEDGDSLLARDELATAVEALASAAEPTEGLYEIRVTAPATAALYRVWPAPILIADATDILSAALDATDFLVAAPTAADTAGIYFAVEPVVSAGYEVDFQRPRVDLVKITAMTEFELGNSFVTVEIDPCVANEPTIASERGAPSNLSTTYDVLGANVRVRQVEFARQLPGVAGIA